MHDGHKYWFRSLVVVLLFRGVFHDTKQTLDKLMYSRFSSRPFYHTCFELKR